VLSLGDISRHFDRPIWMIRRVFTRGFLPEPKRVGVYRVVRAKDLPAVEAALRRAGYLPAKETTEAKAQ
jgi:hypothetical protein